MTDDSPSPAELHTGTMLCIEAIVDALIVRDPGLAVGIEERLVEILRQFSEQPGRRTGAEVPAQVLLTALQRKGRSRRRPG